MVDATRNALNLWAIQLVPSLLPFMILTNLFSPFLYRYISINSSKAEFVIYKFLGLSIQGCYIFLIGQLCGYPLGAKLTGEAYQKGVITKEEGNYLLTICNQSSPAFLEFYVGTYALQKQIPIYILLILFYFSTFMTSFITRKIYRPDISCKHVNSSLPNSVHFFEQLDHSIMDSCITIIRVGGYVLLFAIGSHVLLSIFSFLGENKYLLVSVLEITNGLSFLKNHFYTHHWYPHFILALTAFGGFCTMAQIKGMLIGTSLSIKPYIIGKLIYISVILTMFILFSKINVLFCFQ